MPDIADCSEKEWADYVFHSENRAGVVIEWWMHSGSGYWFLVERNTVTDEILRTWDPEENFPVARSNETRQP